ncbi:MAG: hypothetical protein AAF533_17150 [Acidobacteriota bacterium]
MARGLALLFVLLLPHSAVAVPTPREGGDEALRPCVGDPPCDGLHCPDDIDCNSGQDMTSCDCNGRIGDDWGGCLSFGGEGELSVLGIFSVRRDTEDGFATATLACDVREEIRHSFTWGGGTQSYTVPAGSLSLDLENLGPAELWGLDGWTAWRVVDVWGAVPPTETIALGGSTVPEISLSLSDRELPDGRHAGDLALFYVAEQPIGKYPEGYVVGFLPIALSLTEPLPFPASLAWPVERDGEAVLEVSGLAQPDGSIVFLRGNDLFKSRARATAAP